MPPIVRFALGRLALALPMLLVVATAAFFLEQLVPGDPGSFILGQNATAVEVRQFDASLGVNRPALAQYGSWLGQALRGDLGTSWISRTGVTPTLTAALPVTLSLAGLALVVIVVGGVLIGTFAALHPGGIDRAFQGVSGLVIALPNFWLGIGLIVLFAVRAHLLPPGGYVAPTSPASWLQSLILPVCALAFGPMIVLALQVRSAMIDVLAKDYIRTLRAAGLSRRSVLYKHALRNFMPPVITMIGFQLLGLLAGTVLVEQLFNLPGLGSVMLDSVGQHDVPMVQGIVLLFALFVVLVNLLTDIAVKALDPRSRGQR